MSHPNDFTGDLFSFCIQINYSDGLSTDDPRIAVTF